MIMGVWEIFGNSQGAVGAIPSRKKNNSMDGNRKKIKWGWNIII